MPEDALALATLETGVALYALDAGARARRRGHRGRRERLALADERGPIAPLFSPPGPGHAPGAATRELLLVAVVAPEVPALFVEEAVWTAAAALPTVDASS